LDSRPTLPNLPNNFPNNPPSNFPNSAPQNPPNSFRDSEEIEFNAGEELVIPTITTGAARPPQGMGESLSKQTGDDLEVNLAQIELLSSLRLLQAATRLGLVRPLNW
jgi:hypothetical protein